MSTEEKGAPASRAGQFVVYSSQRKHAEGEQKPHVLIADDDPVALGFLVLCVRQAGFEPLPASSGFEALSIARERRPRLAILDIDMPDATGLDVAHFLRTYTDAQIVFVSSHEEHSYHQRAMETGAIAYYVKPTRPGQLILTIRSALSSSAAMDRLRETELHLSAALQSNRSTDIATGMLMERHHLSRHEAVQKLRELADERRCEVHEVARGLLAGHA